MIASRIVVRGGMVYVQGSTSEGGIEAQTKQVLERIELLLESAGLDKSKILTAKVLLADMTLREAHNAAWSEWINGRCSPIRIFRPALLTHPGALVEITLTAAK